MQPDIITYSMDCMKGEIRILTYLLLYNPYCDYQTPYSGKQNEFDIGCFGCLDYYIPLLYTLTDLDSSCPRSLLKTTPPTPGYSWVSGGRYLTPEPRFRGLVLNHQG